MVKRNLCRNDDNPIAPGSKGYCAECLKRSRERSRKRLGYHPWKKGGPGRPPLMRKEA